MLLEYFQMVDRVDAIDATAQTIECAAMVPAESPVFEGHFPGYPLMPGTLLIETIAQAGGWLLMALNGHEQLPVLIQVVKAKIREAVEPGTTLQVSARVLQISSGIAAIDGYITANGRRAAECEIRYRTMAFPNDTLRDMVTGRAMEIGATARAADAAN